MMGWVVVGGCEWWWVVVGGGGWWWVGYVRCGVELLVIYIQQTYKMLLLDMYTVAAI